MNTNAKTETERAGRCPAPTKVMRITLDSALRGRWPTPTKTQKLKYCVLKFLVSWTFKDKTKQNKEWDVVPYPTKGISIPLDSA